MAEEPEYRGTEELVQIGDLARRTGVSVDTLRAWERRYGLLRPRRSPGGFRLYSMLDEDTVRAMLAEIDRGFPPAQAAKLALAHAPRPDRTTVATASTASTALAATDALALARTELYTALTSFHSGLAHQLLDELFAAFTVGAVLGDVVLPCLADIGDGWEQGTVTVAEEHFASNLLRERLLGLARPWDLGAGPRAILACPPGERHDIALICFGIVLARSGWRITFLGSDTPIGTIAEAADALEPDLVVLASILDGPLAAAAPAIRELATARPVSLAGRGATADLARSTGSTLLTAPPVAAATQVAGTRSR